MPIQPGTVRTGQTLKYFNSQQKNETRIILNKKKFVHTRGIFKEQKILNIC